MVARRLYARFVAQGRGQPSPWQDLAGQIFLGGEEFRKRTQSLAAGRPMANVPLAQRAPARPSPQAIVQAVADTYGVSAGRVLDRSGGQAYKAAIYLLRRAANKPLREVAQLAGVSAGRVSQIQAEVEAAGQDEKIAAILNAVK